MTTAWQRGRDAEGLVAETLAAEGWQVLARNWRGGRGELDLVVRRGQILRFVEVKARTAGLDAGIEAITPGKQRRIVSAAEAWLSNYGDPFDEVAFLVAWVTPGADGWEVVFLDDAFDA